MKRSLNAIYRKLFKEFGPQHWWPGETPFEVAVGAILTQNTTWTNAAKAITQLKRNRVLSARAIGRLPQANLAPLIRSSGYFNQKAKKLKVFVRHLNGRYAGRMSQMRKVPLEPLREELLGLSGIGAETADSILLYALEKPVFVVDAYTRRVLARHALVPWEASYGQIQAVFMRHLSREVPLFNEYHALIVALARRFCHKRQPACHLCPLRKIGHLRLETDPAPPLAGESGGGANRPKS